MSCKARETSDGPHAGSLCAGPDVPVRMEAKVAWKPKVVESRRLSTWEQQQIRDNIYYVK